MAELVLEVIRRMFWIILELSAPSLIAAMILGLGVSLVQSITQIQEMTLTFVPKLLVLSCIIGFTFPWMLKKLIQFCHFVLVEQWDNFISILYQE